ncbi:snRNA-activating protein complex subunit 3 isoform X2 [Danio rerio]|uniref:snRNA-activating protein complex subunit 3 isoform X2 n=1 Tax=Danio rerio TaxID=7955 RepID=A0AC58HIY0_DANRE
MAEIRKEMPCENVPVYEFVDVNSKEFHIGTFRKLWVDVLNPEMYSYSGTAPEIEDVELIEEMGIEPAILEELKNICSVDSLRSKHEDQDIIPSESHLSTLKLRKRRQDYKETLTRDMVDRHEVYANEMEMLSVGKRPDNVRDLIPEGEVILTFNIMYPILFQRTAANDRSAILEHYTDSLHLKEKRTTHSGAPPLIALVCHN